MAINSISGYSNTGYPVSTLNNRKNGVVASPGVGEKMITSGQSSLSDKEFKDKIYQMNRRDIAAEKNSHGSAAWYQLQHDYISVASPNRTGIIQNTLSSLSKRISMQLRQNANPLALILNNHSIFRSKDIGDNFINIRDASGQVIANYSSGQGWSNVYTEAEESRRRDFTVMWDQAKVRAAQEFGNTVTVIDNAIAGYTSDLKSVVETNTPIDLEKLSAHGITYNAETGQMSIDKAKLQQSTGRQIADKPTVGWRG